MSSFCPRFLRSYTKITNLMFSITLLARARQLVLPFRRLRIEFLSSFSAVLAVLATSFFAVSRGFTSDHQPAFFPLIRLLISLHRRVFLPQSRSRYASLAASSRFRLHLQHQFSGTAGGCRIHPANSSGVFPSAEPETNTTPLPALSSPGF